MLMGPSTGKRKKEGKGKTENILGYSGWVENQ